MYLMSINRVILQFYLIFLLYLNLIANICLNYSQLC